MWARLFFFFCCRHRWVWPERDPVWALWILWEQTGLIPVSVWPGLSGVCRRTQLPRSELGSLSNIDLDILCLEEGNWSLITHSERMLQALASVSVWGCARVIKKKGNRCWCTDSILICQTTILALLSAVVKRPVSTSPFKFTVFKSKSLKTSLSWVIIT